VSSDLVRHFLDTTSNITNFFEVDELLCAHLQRQAFLLCASVHDQGPHAHDSSELYTLNADAATASRELEHSISEGMRANRYTICLRQPNHRELDQSL